MRSRLLAPFHLKDGGTSTARSVEDDDDDDDEFARFSSLSIYAVRVADNWITVVVQRYELSSLFREKHETIYTTRRSS